MKQESSKHDENTLDKSHDSLAHNLNKPQIKVVDGKTVVVNPNQLTTTQAIANMKTKMGPSLIHNSDKRLSPFDHKPQKSTDRWSMEDTQKFYKALQLFGTDFEMIRILFEEQRTRN